MSENNVSLHRVLKATPEKIYRAFTEAAALASWIPPYGFVCIVDTMDARVGGRYHASFQNFSTGNSHSFGGEFVELRPGELIKYTDQFDDPNMPGVMTTTVWLKKNLAGTEVRILQENIPAAIPSDFCYLGWQESLEKLARLVEPEIPDA